MTFVMLKDDRRIICHVAADAIEDVERSVSPDEAERLALFERHRPMFEAIANRLWGAGFQPRVKSWHLPV